MYAMPGIMHGKPNPVERQKCMSVCMLRDRYRYPIIAAIWLATCPCCRSIMLYRRSICKCKEEIDGSRPSAQRKPSPHKPQRAHENRRRGKTARREELDT